VSTDGRMWAWTAAYQLVEAVTKFRMDDAKASLRHRVDAQPWQVAQMLDEARVLAELAKADTSVGYGTGAWLDQRAAEQAEESTRQQYMRDEFIRKNDEWRRESPKEPGEPGEER
jgi:hypothetical protein